MTTHITVGYNRRCWATFAIKDVTPEEIAVLDEDSDASTALLQAMDSADRLTFESESHDKSPSYFYAGDQPAVVEISTEDEEAAQ